jgi:hypothetical protein
VNSSVRGNLAVRKWVLLILATAFVAPARADQPSAYGPELEGFEYPFTPERFSFPSQGQTVSMTFMGGEMAGTGITGGRPDRRCRPDTRVLSGLMS